MGHGHRISNQIKRSNMIYSQSVVGWRSSSGAFLLSASSNAVQCRMDRRFWREDRCRHEETGVRRRMEMQPFG